MRTRFIAIPLALLLALPVGASIGLTKKDKAAPHDAVVVLDALTSAPDKGIPQELLPKVDCILIYPSLTQGAFIVGGKGGYGVVSCRQSDGKMGSAPFYTVGGAPRPPDVLHDFRTVTEVVSASGRLIREMAPRFFQAQAEGAGHGQNPGC